MRSEKISIYNLFINLEYYSIVIMSARRYLAWNMLATATYEDERREQGKFQAGMRTVVGNPLEHLSENNFIKDFRLNKEAFEDLCELLRCHTDLKSTQRVSLESKVNKLI